MTVRDIGRSFALMHGIPEVNLRALIVMAGQTVLLRHLWEDSPKYVTRYSNYNNEQQIVMFNSNK